MPEPVSVFEEFLADVAKGDPMDVAANAALAKLKANQPKPEPEAEPDDEDAVNHESHAKRGRR